MDMDTMIAAAALPGARIALASYAEQTERIRAIAATLEAEAEAAHVDTAALLLRIAREIRDAIGDARDTLPPCPLCGEPAGEPWPVADLTSITCSECYDGAPDSRPQPVGTGATVDDARLAWRVACEGWDDPDLGDVHDELKRRP